MFVLREDGEGAALLGSMVPHVSLWLRVTPGGRVTRMPDGFAWFPGLETETAGSQDPAVWLSLGRDVSHPRL